MSRRWLTGYLIVLFGTVPVAWPCWNGFLRDWVGRVLTVEAIHVVEYGGLGWVGALYVRTLDMPRRRWGLIVWLAGAGLLDELAQGWLPQRVFQWSDVGLNWMGLLLGLTLCGIAGARVSRGQSPVGGSHKSGTVPPRGTGELGRITDGL